MSDNCILEFLTELREHNRLDWMAANKDFKKEAASQFEMLVQNIITGLSVSDPSIAHLQAKDLTFRLNRDTRFGHDKSPYLPAFRAHIAPDGRAPVPVGYFLFIAPGGIFLGGGLFASQFTDATARIRSYIEKHGDAFLDILNAPGFQENFTLIGEKLKNVPRGFDASLPCSEYLKYKSWALECHMNDASLSDSSEFSRRAVGLFLQMRPFNDCLNTALQGFKMPVR